jgi:hypothetical protein
MKPSNTFVSQEGESWVTSVRELELFKKVIELLLKENLEVHILLMKYDGKPGILFKGHLQIRGRALRSEKVTCEANTFWFYML